MSFLDTMIGRPNTIKTYKSLFNNWIEPEIPNPKTFDQTAYYTLIKNWQKSCAKSSV